MFSRSSLLKFGFAFNNIKSSCQLSFSSSSKFQTTRLYSTNGIQSKQTLNVKIDLDIPQRSTLSFVAKDNPGALSKCLALIAECGVNLTRIESRYVQDYENVKFRVDMAEAYRSKKIQNIIKLLEPLCMNVSLEEPRKVPWFPITTPQMDALALLTLDSEELIQQNIERGEKDLPPQFTDLPYRERRNKITEAAKSYSYPDPPSIVDYSPEEIECWGIIWKALKPLLEKHACDEYWETAKDLHKECGYTEDNIPQLAHINEFIEKRTGFRLRPTAGLLSSRHFLNGLAFKTFFCTQYIRHPSKPFYTPEPDVVHELVGHAPMFADKEFARFSQEIGLASIGASDDQIDQLARCYWYSVEFGVCKTKTSNSNELKAYGAGVLSSVDEIKNAMKYAPMENGEFPEFRQFNPFEAAMHPFPITKLQDIYYVADSFEDATKRMSHFAEYLDKPFSVSWDDEHKELICDGNIYRDEYKTQIGTYG